MSDTTFDPRFESLLREALKADAARLAVTVTPEQILERGRARQRGRSGWGTNFPRLTMAVAAGGAAVLLVFAGTVGLTFFVNQQPGVGVVSPSPSAVRASTEPSDASPEPSAASPVVFTEIAPGEMVEIPDWPLTARTSPRAVWTGAELIAWGAGDDLAGDGAAFNLASGTWRVLADSPLSPRSESAVTWTGTEMIVWGGRVENSFYYDGAAYNPVTDAWRLLPRPPAGFAGKDPSMVWAGDEALVFGTMGNSETTGEYIAAAAYDPVTDSWRSLANVPASVGWVDERRAWWTGESIVAATLVGQTGPTVGRMARYDVAADSWTVVEIGSSSAVVGVRGSDGSVSGFVNLPRATGGPVEMIDISGTVIAELPAFPGDRSVFGDEVAAYGVWVGHEAVFEIWNARRDDEPQQIWALNPSSQTWRRLDADVAIPRIDWSTVAAGDLLLMWNGPDDVYRGTPRMCCSAPPSKGGAIYRLGASPSEDQ